MTTILVYLAGLMVILIPARHLEPGLTFREAAEIYYEPTQGQTYGYATRYGSDELAFWELRRGAEEVQDQSRRGWVLLGGGYGYRTLAGTEYLLDNRSALGYSLMADSIYQQIANDNQRRLLYLASMTPDEMRGYVDGKYIGIISTRSPNDIGAEFCVYDLFTENTRGLAIVGGAAARNDYTYYGPSVNDAYGHERLGTRKLLGGAFDFHWIADLSDSVWDDLTPYFGYPARTLALLDKEYCDE